MLGVAWIQLPPPGPAQQGAEGELQMACFDATGLPRQLPDGRVMEQLVITQRVVPTMASLLPQLREFILYKGDTSRAGAQQGGVGGHYVACRRAADGQWYLIDSLGNAPAALDLPQYIRTMPHGLMAAVPLDATVASTDLWKTYVAMSRFPQLETLCAMLDMTVSPRQIVDWLEFRQLDGRDLGNPDLVGLLLSDISGQPWRSSHWRIPDVLDIVPQQALTPQEAMQKVQDRGVVEDVLHRLDALHRDSVMLCLGVQPFHLRAYRHAGEWRCMAEPVTGRHQDLHSPQPVEQSLKDVLARSFADVAERHAPGTPAQRHEDEALRQRTSVSVLVTG
jgi:hypothetical protein